jgi:sugar/nucleoside kinase (ribokinase family)
MGFDIVCVGNYTRDTIVTPAGTRVVPGGAFNFGAHAARALGLRTMAVTHLAREDEAVIRALEAIGVEARVRWTAASTCLRLVYPSDNPDERTLTVVSQADPFTAADVEGIDARAAVLGPSFNGEIGPEVVRALARPGRMIALDVQGFIRRVTDGRMSYAPWDERGEVLPMVTVLKTDAVEAEFLTGEADIHRAARLLQAEGPREVVLTHRDGVLVFDGREEHEAAFMPKALVGRSGRGDTCLAAYVCRRLSDPPAEAILWAAALTSRKLEADGPYKGDYASVAAFIAERYK